MVSMLSQHFSGTISGEVFTEVLDMAARAKGTSQRPHTSHSVIPFHPRHANKKQSTSPALPALLSLTYVPVHTRTHVIRSTSKAVNTAQHRRSPLMAQ
jgi:hypothetical protein